MRLVGLGYRDSLAPWLQQQPAEVGCLEITAEHFFDGGLDRLRQLAGRYPLYVHGLGLSLGAPGPLDPAAVKQFVQVAQAADARWVSEHVAFTRTADVDLGHLNPIPLSRTSLQVMVDHALELADACGRLLLLENVTSEFQIAGGLQETDFLNQLCDQAKCGLLLDVTNLWINSRNHRFDPLAWLRELEPATVRQLHIVGYSQRGDHYVDHHSAVIQPQLMELLTAVLEYGAVESIILERDERLDQIAEITHELTRLEQASHAARSHHGARSAAQQS
ncbi:DUF692 domain-containing protein [Lignipirellula cremea]|uniref:Xylose isomerase-like TIM barrel n=1 Tax=Lignipirellula cremea TaxID=2528010 RepID=A0A518DX42_9BACT|nr:DUF692 family multinuclear iron-containing protein [Lignipirellula cremea]QDU96423.1 hypothetical protein Pla8534_42430 [Lignipirellula cremea]